MARMGYEKDVAVFPAKCGTPQLAWVELEQAATSFSNANIQMKVLGSACLPAESDIEEHSGYKLMPLDSCFKWLVNPEIVDTYLRQGVHFLTPGWLRHWREYLSDWGFDQQTASEFFHETTSKLVLLDTMVDPGAADLLKEFAEYLDLSWEIIPVGLDYLCMHLENQILEEKLVQQIEDRELQLNQSNQEIANYSMIFDLLGNLTVNQGKSDVIDNILNVFNILFSPRILVFCQENGEKSVLPYQSNEVPSWLEEEHERFRLKEQWHEFPNGFMIRILSGDDSLGCLAVADFNFPEYRENYLKQAINIVPWVNLAISNAHYHEKIEESKKEIQAERDKARNYFNSAKIILIVFDKDGNVSLINQQGLDILGYAEDDVIEKNWFDHFIPDWDRQRTKSGFAQLMSGDIEPVEEFTNPILTKSGEERTILWNNTLLKNEQGEAIGSLSSGKDITERIRITNELEDALGELTRSNQDLEQFAYIASHDLKEPLRMVSSYLRLIEKRYGAVLDESGREFIQFAVDGATRMTKMIGDLLTFSRVGTRGNPFEQFDLKVPVNQAIQNLAVQIHKAEAIISQDSLPEVLADETQLVQVFQNLISNALKYHGEQPVKIHIGAKQIRQKWHFSVSDNGIGIKPENHERIFGIFQRLHTDEEFEGAGIGLSITKRIIERHGGEIWVDSEPGEGSIFYFTLPTRSG